MNTEGSADGSGDRVKSLVERQRLSDRSEDVVVKIRVGSTVLILFVAAATASFL